MAGIEHPSVCKSFEEWHESVSGEKEFTIQFTLRGEITIFGKDKLDAIERLSQFANSELLDYIEEVDFE